MALLASPRALAVSLSTDGLGQALIYPYYTVQSTDGSAFNTYISITNHGGWAKAVRVRFREGRMGKEVLGFNLFLANGDTWTGAVIPSGSGARLITRDASCTDPAFTTEGPGVTSVDFRNAAFTGANGDGAGEELERTREGYVEVLEMATLEFAASTHLRPGAEQNCGLGRANAAQAVLAPTGLLGGTLSLLNVATGLVFTMQAEALADLGSRPYFRAPSDPYPDFSAAEIDPVSVVTHDGAVYRSRWARPQDAVSAVLMTWRLSFDFVLDRATASTTDLVAVLPTRRLYGSEGPFSVAQKWSPDCARNGLNGEALGIWWYDREARQTVYNADCGDMGCVPLSAPNVLCATAGVGPVRRAAIPGAATPSDVLGSRTLGLAKGQIVLPERAENGRIVLISAAGIAVPALHSMPDSTRLTISTGLIAFGRHRYYGVPMIGATFFVYRNGALPCGPLLCQGSFGSAFRMRAERLVEIWPP